MVLLIKFIVKFIVKMVFIVKFIAIYPWNTIKWKKKPQLNLLKVKQEKQEFTTSKNRIEENFSLYILQ